MDLNFYLPNGKQIHVEIEKNSSCLTSPYQRIYDGYLRLRLQDLVVRSGAVFCGSYPKATSPNNTVATLGNDSKFSYTGSGIDHPETVSMHAMGCINLLRMFVDEFPELFVPEPQSTSESYNNKLLRVRERLTRLFVYHDSSEAFCGDYPDDGSFPEETKNSIELEIFKRNIEHIQPIEAKILLIRDFVSFQYPTVNNLYEFQSDYDFHLIQIAKLIDKVDAILASLKNELEGHPGFLSKKVETCGSITRQDLFFVNLCGTSAIADCWTAHFVTDYREFYGFESMMNLLYTAVIHTRGKWYPWWEKICQKYPDINFTPPK